MKLNFSVFVDKVASGEKTQTIRLWDQPSIKKLKVGDKVNLWHNRRGLKTGLYCAYCLEEGRVVWCGPSQTRPDWEGIACVHSDRNPEGQAILVPRLLGVGTVTEKIAVCFTDEGILYWSRDLPEMAEGLAKKDGFESAQQMAEWFHKKYEFGSDPMKFAVIRWRLDKTNGH